jgi:Uma2 family endonuclease
MHAPVALWDLPSVHHQRVRDRLSRALAAYLAPFDLDESVVTAPCLVAGRQLAMADVAVYPRGGLAPAWDECAPPLFVAEIVSADTAIDDRVIKRQFYLDQGVATYWVIDPDGAQVDVWFPRDVAPRQVTGYLRWTAQSSWPPFEIHIGELTSR